MKKSCVTSTPSTETDHKMNDGDWICPDANCGNINFARRVSCYRCNKERPESTKKKLGTEIGKSAAEKSRGLFNADDWQCSKCANVNWARRQTCNVCNAPKFGEVEARTGYGGGYNERGVVEYRRRESSSDDEYDEFGRKKRKRGHSSKTDNLETQEKVGITEGPAFNKLPPRMLQKDLKKDHVIPGLTTNMSRSTNNRNDNVNGSLSDGSVCDLPPLSKMAFRRHQLQNHTRQDYNMTPNYRPGNQFRKRHVSIGDRETTASSGYETGSKKSKYDNSCEYKSAKKPVMENSVSSTNNDVVVYKFTGATPAENFEVTYTLEERVKVAAFAICYNNCKVTRDKFEQFFDKPAPDFKTIFAWRQRLLATGCLVDSHLNRPTEMPPTSSNSSNSNTNASLKESAAKLINPEEIAVISDDEIEPSKNTPVQENITKKHRSVSLETLVLVGAESNRTGGSSISVAEDSETRGRSRSTSTHHRTRSSSRDSQDSNYPDSAPEHENNSNSINHSHKSNKSSRHSTQDSESESESTSYDSEDQDFLSRKFGGKKAAPQPITKCPPTKSSIPVRYPPVSTLNFQGYSTVKPNEKSPLASGKIYTPNLRNMIAKTNDNFDTDGCSSEYVPTRLGSTAKKNYQDFKNNVIKKGYWAKANGNAIGNRSYVKTSPQQLNSYLPTNIRQFETTAAPNELFSNAPPVQIFNNSTECYPQARECVKAPPEPIQPTPIIQASAPKPIVQVSTAIPLVQATSSEQVQHHYDSNMKKSDYIMHIDKSEKPTMIYETIPDNVSSIFDMVQSNSVIKNRSIMDIFSNNDVVEDATINDKDETTPKVYNNDWDVDDDDLYKSDSEPVSKLNAPSSLTESQPPVFSPVTTGGTDYSSKENTPQKLAPNKLSAEIIQEKRDMLLGLFTELQSKNINNQQVEIQNNLNPNSQSNMLKVQTTPTPGNYLENHNAAKMKMTTTPEPVPLEISKEIEYLSREEPTHLKKDDLVETSSNKKVHIIESVTIKPGEIQNYIKPVKQSSATTYSTDNSPQKIVNNTVEASKEPEKPAQLDLSSLLSGINTNTLLLALQNLQQLTQPQQQPNNTEQENEDNIEGNVETINLTNDEEWERETNKEGSIERQLEQLDGCSGDTPFLSDIFDPGPVKMPQSLPKLSLNLKKTEDNNDTEGSLVNDNAPVIGNFKSFALPKPILLNRLKLTVKQPEKHCNEERKKVHRTKKKTSSPKESKEGDEDEESGDEADLSKYDLWGSDAEQDDSSKTESTQKPKEGSSSKDGRGSKDVNQDEEETNGASEKKKKRRSRSSSSSSSTSSSSSSSQSSSQAPKNRFDDFNLNSERESSPKGRKSRSRSRSPRARSASSRRKSRDSRSAGETRTHDASRDKERSRDRERRERRGTRDDRKERRYSRDGNHYSARGRHR